MSLVTISVGDDLRFAARLEEDRAPRTCDAFRRALPLTRKLLQARWSGESAWIPLGEMFFGVPFENHTSHPLPDNCCCTREG